MAVLLLKIRISPRLNIESSGWFAIRSNWMNNSPLERNMVDTYACHCTVRVWWREVLRLPLAVRWDLGAFTFSFSAGVLDNCVHPTMAFVLFWVSLICSCHGAKNTFSDWYTFSKSRNNTRAQGCTHLYFLGPTSLTARHDTGREGGVDFST